MSIRTSRADRNVLSWSGETLTWYSGTDHPEPCNRVPNDVYPNVPSDWDSALKVSGNTYAIHIDRIRAAQCRENVIDINHSHHVTIGGVFGRPGEVGEQVITIKGGSSDIILSGAIQSKGTNGTIVIGQWSDQSNDLARDIDLTGLYPVEGEVITVIFARADRKSVRLPKGAKVLWFKSLLFTAYWWAKWVYVKILKAFGKA